MAEPLAGRYGKQAVSVYRSDGERLFACSVDVIVHGRALATSYSEGDNSLVVATDSMKNFVQRTALDFEGESLEEFLGEIGRRFLDRYDHIDGIDMHADEVPFARRAGNVLQPLHDDIAVADVALGRDGQRYEWSGLKDLRLVKLKGSSFAEFVRDEYTTLPEATDRPLFVYLDVQWINADTARRASNAEMRTLLVETFAGFESASIQHLVHEMGTRALERFELATISFRAENRLWDTAAEAGGVTVYTDARPPFGVIELTLRR